MCNEMTTTREAGDYADHIEKWTVPILFFCGRPR